jgi:hypothetical protein
MIHSCSRLGRTPNVVEQLREGDGRSSRLSSAPLVDGRFTVIQFTAFLQSRRQLAWRDPGGRWLSALLRQIGRDLALSYREWNG